MTMDTTSDAESLRGVKRKAEDDASVDSSVPRRIQVRLSGLLPSIAELYTDIRRRH